MLNGRNLILDTMGEQYELLRPYSDGEFWDFATHDPVPNSVYVLGRQQILDNVVKFRAMAEDPQYVMVFGNSAEGSATILAQINMLGLDHLVRAKKVLVISGGDLEPDIPYLLHEHFLIRVLDYEENIKAISHCEMIYDTAPKPYKFLFLNGRARPHRKYLLERFRLAGILDQSLWTMIDGRRAGSRMFRLEHQGVNLMDTNTPIRFLPAEYECDRYQNNGALIDISYPHQYPKVDLFAKEWGEIYLTIRPYADTYFSLVTETIIDYPYSFRTEKIAKPLAIGHPWIAATSRGFYRDLRNLGFRSFDGIVDESFDLIDNPQDRMDRIFEIVRDLCGQDLGAFLAAAKPMCKYNQQHLSEIARDHKSQFSQQFFDFVTLHRHG